MIVVEIVGGILLYLVAIAIIVAVMAPRAPGGYPSGRIEDLNDIPRPSPGPAPGATDRPGGGGG